MIAVIWSTFGKIYTYFSFQISIFHFGLIVSNVHLEDDYSLIQSLLFCENQVIAVIFARLSNYQYSWRGFPDVGIWSVQSEKGGKGVVGRVRAGGSQSLTHSHPWKGFSVFMCWGWSYIHWGREYMRSKWKPLMRLLFMWICACTLPHSDMLTRVVNITFCKIGFVPRAWAHISYVVQIQFICNNVTEA